MSTSLFVSEVKDKLWKELALKAELITDGVAITKEALELIRPGELSQEQVHCLFEMDFETHDFELPSGFLLPHGLSTQFRWNPKSEHIINVDRNRPVLTRKGHSLGEVTFHPRPGFYSKHTFDGHEMGNIGAFYQPSSLFVVYSNECSYKEKDEDCLFCNINHTKDTYAEKEGIFWKTARQIGETAAEAYREGVVDHVTISGGVIPERRELDYYLDVAEEIISQTGLEDFNGTATVAAPLDLRNIDRFKEAGYRTTAMNIEIWDKGYYDTICPGKARGGGGWEHWVKALEYAVTVFGHGRVRSNIVAGLEPKKKSLEGLEYLAAQGVFGTFTIWCPNPGSGLEGHRAPEPSWYLDLAHRLVPIWKKNGFTYDQAHDCHASSDSLQHDVWRIQDEMLPIFSELQKAA
jgi:Radical SAM superfamily